MFWEKFLAIAKARFAADFFHRQVVQRARSTAGRFALERAYRGMRDPGARRVIATDMTGRVQRLQGMYRYVNSYRQVNFG